MPLLSVIIPTHNRPDCAVPTIRAVLAASEDIEVVVSDTSPEDKISPAFAGEQIERLKLLRPGQGLSVVDNFNRALLAASGDYLVFIGDDDLVAPQIARVADWARAQRIEAISFSFPALYYWPNFRSTTRWKASSATLCVSQFSGKATAFDPHDKLSEALKNLGAGVLDMPRAYAGMVSRTLVDRIVAKNGALFGGVSPDIYSAALISLESRKSYRLDFPVVIPGASGASTSGHSAQGRHVGGLRDNPHIGAFKNLVWDERVPEYYSVPTVWGFSLLKAIEDKPAWLARANFSRLYLKCLISNPQYKSLVFNCLLGHARSKGRFRAGAEFIAALTAEAARIAKVLWARRQKQGASEGAALVIEHVNDTRHALDVLSAHLAQAGAELRLDSAT